MQQVASREHHFTSRMAMNWLLFCQGPSPMKARYVYAVLFLLANLSAWLMRENRISYYLAQRGNARCHGDQGCLAAQSVLTISLTFCVSSTTINIFFPI